MRYYELLYIVNPNLEDDRVNGIIDEIGNEVKKYDVNIINHHIWGKKRLAYPVKNNKYGIYILLQFATEKFDFLKEFERFLILSKSVIRHQIVRLEEEPKKVERIELENDDDSETKEEKLDAADDSVDDELSKEETIESAEEKGEEEKEENIGTTVEEKPEEETSDDVEEKKEEKK